MVTTWLPELRVFTGPHPQVGREKACVCDPLLGFSPFVREDGLFPRSSPQALPYTVGPMAPSGCKAVRGHKHVPFQPLRWEAGGEEGVQE